jgi:hypothetical protein
MSLKQNAVIVAVSILFTILIFVIVDAVYPAPEYGDYCKNEGMPRPYLDKPDVKCEYQQTQAEYDCSMEGGISRFDYDDNGCQKFSKCDMCGVEYDNSRKKYSDLLFLIIAPIGALAIILGAYYKVEFIGTGFMFSGILLMTISTIQNFGDLNKFTRILVISLELGLVLFIAYKKILVKDNTKKSLNKK